MIKRNLFIAGFLLLVAVFIYAIATKLPDEQIQITNTGGLLPAQQGQQQTQQPQQQAPAQNAGLANPASVNCVQTLSGQLEIVNTAQGQVGMCHLQDGRVCEEWTLFRDNKCVNENGQ